MYSICVAPLHVRGGGRRDYGGHGQGRSGQDTRMKRDFDRGLRKSSDERTGIKAVDKKEGSGPHNWGTFEDEMKAKDDKATDAPPAPASPTPKDKEALARKAAEEEEANMMTLDQWKAQRAKKEGPTFNLRKAGEGYENDPKWKKTYAYKKDVLTQEDEEDEVSTAYKYKYPIRKIDWKYKKQLLQVQNGVNQIVKFY